MNGKKSDTFEIKVSKIEIKSANKQENATILTAITGGGNDYLKNLLIFYIFGAVETCVSFTRVSFW
jgi:hypothetical protein